MRRRSRTTGVGAIAVLLAVAVALLLSRGLLPLRGTAAAAPPPLPGLTLVDDEDDSGLPAPVVTSLRSDGAAERAGLRVGDHIAAVDGRPVRSIAALRTAMSDSRGPIALHVERGNAVWNVALDRAEPAEDDANRHEP